MNKTNKDFKRFLQDNGITYDDLSRLTGIKHTSLTSQLSNTKSTPKWAITYMAGFELGHKKPIMTVTLYECDCTLDKGVLKRGKSGCKLTKEQHKF